MGNIVLLNSKIKRGTGCYSSADETVKLKNTNPNSNHGRVSYKNWSRF